MKIINLPRRAGKSTMLIYSAYVTDTPILVSTEAQKEILEKQAKKLGLSITVYTAFEWINYRNHYRHEDKPQIMIDEALSIIDEALNLYLNAKVEACTLTLPQIEIPQAKEAAKDE